MGKMSHMPPDFQARAHELMEAGRYLFERGWMPAASGNLSSRLSDGTIAITVSGRHKGRLHAGDIMVIDIEGHPQMSTQRPSADTPLHTAIYRLYPEVSAVLHTHSLNATLLSQAISSSLRLQGYEMLKTFAGVTTHKTAIVIPNFANDQDTTRLASGVENYLEANGPIYGFLIAGHGLFTWGRSVEEALRYVEAFEFLFQCELHGYRLKG